jgi:hypothetical protein
LLSLGKYIPGKNRGYVRPKFVKYLWLWQRRDAKLSFYSLLINIILMCTRFCRTYINLTVSVLYYFAIKVNSYQKHILMTFSVKKGCLPCTCFDLFALVPYPAFSTPCWCPCLWFCGSGFYGMLWWLLSLIVILLCWFSHIYFVNFFN